MKDKDKIIAKQEELIEELDHYYLSKKIPHLDELNRVEELKSELAALKSQEQEPDGAEEIVEIILNILTNYPNNHIEIAKAIAKELEQYHNSKRREELIKYMIWLEEEPNKPMIEKIIDEYLSKNK